MEYELSLIQKIAMVVSVLFGLFGPIIVMGMVFGSAGAPVGVIFGFLVAGGIVVGWDIWIDHKWYSLRRKGEQ